MDLSNMSDTSGASKLSPASTSEWGRDVRRGAAFTSAKRHLLDRTEKVKGPEYYLNAEQCTALKTNGVGAIGRDRRRTMDVMYQKGKVSPGVGKYNPPARKESRGGSIGSASRFRYSIPTDKKPGPESYSPRYSFSSRFK
jgi:hypothetical protein